MLIMKAFIMIMLCLVLFTVPVTALSSTLKTLYSPSETAIIRLDGIILEPISPESFKILRNGHVEVPVEYDVRHIANSDFIWFIAPQNTGNYTLAINDIATRTNGAELRVSYLQNFTIEGNVGDYTIRPGFIDTQYDFDINIEMRNDAPKKIQISLPYPHEEIIIPGTNSLHFAAADFRQNQIATLSIGEYELPVYIRGNITSSATLVLSSLEFLPERILQRINYSEAISSYRVGIINHDTQDAKNIILDYNKQLMQIKPDSFKVIKPDEIAYFNVSLKKRPVETLHETIYARKGEVSFPLLIEIIVVNETKDAETNVTAQGLYCAELGGAVCKGEDRCSGATVASRDGACCKDTCIAPEKQTSNIWIGYALAGVVLIGIALLWLRYKEAPRKNHFAERVASAEKKFS